MTDEITDCVDVEFSAFLEEEGLSFEDSKWMARALIHRSYAFEQDLEGDNERLEFLGDAVLGLVVSELLFQTNADASEGVLSKQRSRLVSRKVLGRLARRIGLGRRLLLGVGEEKTGGRDRLSTLGCCLESVIGAIYLEKGADSCRRFTERFLMSLLEAESVADGGWDAKSRLQEVVQATGSPVPEYSLVEQSGPDHERTFIVDVLIEGTVRGRGEGKRIKVAENAAAAVALGKMEKSAGHGDK